MPAILERKSRRVPRFVIAALMAATGLANSAQASSIDFADQPAGSNSFGAPAQVLNYNVGGVSAVFSGGVILTNETGSGDLTNVYATTSFAGSYGSTITLSLSQPVSNFSLDVTNAIVGNYLVSDNAGHSFAFNLPVQGFSTQTVSFASVGTLLTVAYTGGSAWDFAIDNVKFDTAAVPEPASWALMILGFGGLGFAVRRRRAVI